MLNIFADVSRDMADQLLFEQITRMCFARILSRLRSKHAAKTRKTKNRPKMLLLLAEAVSKHRHESSVGTFGNVPGMTGIHKQSKELKIVFQKLEDSNDKDTLLQCLRKLLSLAIHFDVQALVTILQQSRAVDPTLQDYLPKAISKLGLYRAIATGLANAARTTRHSLFERITVRPIKGPDLQPDNGTLNSALQDFEAVWSRSVKDTSYDLLRPLHEITKSRYHSRILSRCTKWKVHAEIQILCFYEQRPNQPLPRAICASKSACYLCNLFLEMHGKFVVPRTHGKIYDRWTLPPHSFLNSETIQRLLPVIHQFNRAVEIMTLRVLNGEIGRYPPPNESVLAVYEPWSSHSTIVPRQSAEPIPLLGQDAFLPAKPHQGPFRGENDPPATSRASSSSSETSISIKSAGNTYSTFLKQGEQICKDFEQGDCVLVQTPAIHLQFSRSSDCFGDARRSVPRAERYRIRVEHLREESELACDTQRVDVNALRCDQSEVICFNHTSSVGSIVCYKGEHRVCVTFEKVLGSLMTQDT